MKILVLCAMVAELEGFLKKVKSEPIIVAGNTLHKAKINDNDIYFVKCGVGKVNAAMLTTTLILKLKPRYIINAGIAGGLNENLPIYSIVASTKIYQHDMDLTTFGYDMGELDDHTKYFEGSKKLLSLLDGDVIKGQMVSGDQFVATKEKLELIKKNFKKALTCDMEGSAIAQVCHFMSRKFLIIRCVSDNVFLQHKSESYSDEYYDAKPIAIAKVVDKTLDLISKL